LLCHAYSPVLHNMTIRKRLTKKGEEYKFEFSVSSP
jgi:hypothetical protein